MPLDVTTGLIIANLVLTGVVTVLQSTRWKCRCCGGGTFDLRPKDAPSSPPSAPPPQITETPPSPQVVRVKTPIPPV